MGSEHRVQTFTHPPTYLPSSLPPYHIYFLRQEAGSCYAAVLLPQSPACWPCRLSLALFDMATKPSLFFWVPTAQLEERAEQICSKSYLIQVEREKMQMELSHKRARVELERAASTNARNYEVGPASPRRHRAVCSTCQTTKLGPSCWVRGTRAFFCGYLMLAGRRRVASCGVSAEGAVCWVICSVILLPLFSRRIVVIWKKYSGVGVWVG